MTTTEKIEQMRLLSNELADKYEFVLLNSDKVKSSDFVSISYLTGKINLLNKEIQKELKTN